MYRLVLESLLGLRLETDRLVVEPLVPAAWDAFVIHYRYHQTLYHLHVRASAGTGKKTVTSVRCDGEEQKEVFVLLKNDGKEHRVDIEMGETELRLAR